MSEPEALLTWEGLRTFALSLRLPNVEDVVSWGQPNLKAHGKMWVWRAQAKKTFLKKWDFEQAGAQA
jgi:hypothetical protein